MKKILPFILLLFSVTAFSQFSKTHYIPPLSNSDVISPDEQYLYISTPNLAPVNFIIKELGGNNIAGTVSRNTPYVYDTNSGNPGQFIISQFEANNIMSNKGYVIEAEDIIYVTARVIAGNGNQAGALVSKGLASLGKQFRIGGFLNTLTVNYNDPKYTFVSVLATENNTLVQFSDIKTGVSLVNNASVGNTPSDIILNAGESFVMAVQGGIGVDANRDGLIGSAVTSNKPIAVNCGSFAGSNGDNENNLDLGFDQIVSAERTGTDYIFIKSSGQDPIERILLVADVDNTQIFLNGNTTTASYTLNNGEYVTLIGSDYSSQGNLYVHSSEKIFAYQSVGDNTRTDQANQELFFVPPLSCQTPHDIDNIPLIDEIGSRTFVGRITIVTQTGSSLNFIINNIPYNLASLPANISGPTSVTGNTNYETYTISGLSGNVSVFSSGELYLAAYGTDGAATFGGFYSGFTFKPEVTFDTVSATQSSCIPNVTLSVNTLTAFDDFQWYFNNAIIPGATTNSYVPNILGPGFYYVSATISACGTTLVSDNIPVSDCPKNSDNDPVNNNVDLDSDNDGIPNCLESFGDLSLNLSTPNVSTAVNIGNYTNNFTGIVSTFGTSSISGNFSGDNNGIFVSEVLAGKGNYVNYTINNFAQPMSVEMKYVTTANATDLINSGATFYVRSNTETNVTVLNQDNQLLIDTNYDGIFESGITEFSSFEIRFRVNSNTPLAAGTGTFSFRSNLATSFSITQENLSDSSNNKATFSIITTCVPKDNDGDGIPDQQDTDSDNDGIPDNKEYMSQSYIPYSNVDANNNGIDDAYEVSIIASDVDMDGVPDYYDLDSDNDGIYDLAESGSNATDSNNNGIIDGNPASFGTNGISNSLETAADNGILNYSLTNTDNFVFDNYADNDSDGDGCPDVIEAGFSDGNSDTYLGNNPVTVNPTNGLVTNATNGYTNPNPNYITAAPITISQDPVNQNICELNNVTFTVISNPVNGYQWQVSVDNGITFTNIVNNTIYSGATTSNLLINSIIGSMNGYKYRVYLSKNGNTCGLYSGFANLNILSLPVIISPITLKQCDSNTDGITDFNLLVKNNQISVNSANETFSYFTSFSGADTNDILFKINTPTVYNSGNGTVWARVENANLCYRVATINLIVSVPQLNPVDVQKNLVRCDDNITGVSTDTDGFSEGFDFTSETALINSFLPSPSSNYEVKYYETEADALAEVNQITNTTNYRNIIPNQQSIWVRVDSNLDNGCFGLNPFLTLTVEALPVAHPILDYKVCDDDNSTNTFTFDTSALQSNLLQGQNNVIVTYFDQANNPLTSPFPATFTTVSQTIKARVTNTITNTTDGIPCYDETFIKFIVDIRPIANPVSPVLLTRCDDEMDPLLQNGSVAFDTSGFEATILNGQTGMIVTYFDGNGNPILPDLGNTFDTGTQNVKVVVTNPLNNTCPAILILNFVVKPLPKILITHSEIVCTNLPTFFVTLTAGIQDGTPTSNYSYVWSFNNSIIPTAIGPTLDVNTEGIYTVQVTNSVGCPVIRTITVIASDVAHLDPPTIIDLVDINSITVNIGSGQGIYEFSLDEPFGPFQTSNYFANVPLGFHTVYINDTNGCGIVEQIIAVVGAPKYFTPNGDGSNDYWNIRGISSTNNLNSVIYIFDRFGKLIKQISSIGQGWDGTFNGQPVPADDYWFTLQLEDGRNLKGHFTLKR